MVSSVLKQRHDTLCLMQSQLSMIESKAQSLSKNRTHLNNSQSKFQACRMLSCVKHVRYVKEGETAYYISLVPATVSSSCIATGRISVHWYDADGMMQMVGSQKDM